MHTNRIYPFIKFSNIVSSVCEPLEKFDISLLLYIRLYENGERSILTNHPKWQQHFLNEKLYLLPILGKFDRPERVDVNKVFLFYESWPKLSEFNVSANNFNLTSWLAHIQKFDKYVEYTFFASHNNAVTNNFYINNKKLLINFINYFRCKLSNEILETEKERIILPLSNKEHQHASYETFYEGFLERVSEFEQAITCNEIYISDKEKIIFSKRELECIKYIGKGLTSKEMAKEMFISSRTVEHYIDNIKEKLGVKNKINAFKIVNDIWGVK